MLHGCLLQWCPILVVLEGCSAPCFRCFSASTTESGLPEQGKNKNTQNGGPWGEDPEPAPQEELESLTAGLLGCLWWRIDENKDLHSYSQELLISFKLAQFVFVFPNTIRWGKYREMLCPWTQRKQVNSKVKSDVCSLQQRNHPASYWIYRMEISGTMVVWNIFIAFPRLSIPKVFFFFFFHPLNHRCQNSRPAGQTWPLLTSYLLPQDDTFNIKYFGSHCA